MLFVLLLIVLIVLIAVKRSNPSNLVKRGETRLAAGNLEAARVDFTKAVSLLEKGKGKPQERTALLAQGLLRLGQIFERAGRRDEAFSYYQRARQTGARMPDSAEQMLAEKYVAQQAKSEEAISAYLRYIAPNRPQGGASGVILALLESMCQVSEEMKSAPRKAAAELSQRVISVRPDLEWAHYYLGLSHIVEGRTESALGSFTTAQKLDGKRYLTFYWKCICFLQQLDPDLNAAIDMAERFLPDPVQDQKNQKRKARACSEIAKKLIERLGGFDDALSRKTARQKETLEKTIHFLQLAITYQKKDANLHYLLARCLGQSGDEAGMLKELECADGLAPQEQSYSYWLGKERHRRGDLAGAAEPLRRAAAADPKNANALALLGEVLIWTEDFAGAEKPLKQAISLTRCPPGVLPLLLRALYGQRKFEDVIGTLDSIGGDSLAIEDREAVFAVARSASLSGRFDRAVHWLRQLAEAEEVTYFLGCAYANLNRLPEAFACFGSVADGTGAYAVRALLERGKISLKSGSIELADRDYQEALKREKDNPDVSYVLGVLSFQRDELEAAVQWFRCCLEGDSGDARCLFALGLTYERLGRANDALKAYRQIGATAEQRDEVLLRSGVLQCRQGKFKEALDSFKKCSRSKSELPSLVFYRGLAQAQTGRLQEAITSWTTLLDRSPQNERLTLNLARAHYMAGCQHLDAGRIQEAIASWSTYSKLYPADEKAARDIAELYFRLAAETTSKDDGKSRARVIELLQAAVNGDPGNKVYSFYLMLAKLRNGHAKECREEFTMLIASEGTRPRLLYHSALCSLISGDRQGAMKQLTDLVHAGHQDQYGRCAAWALGNEQLREGETEAAMATLSQTAADFHLAH